MDPAHEPETIWLTSGQTRLGFTKDRGRLIHFIDRRFAGDLIKAPHANQYAPFTLSILGPGREMLLVRPGPVAGIRQTGDMIGMRHDWCEAGPEGTRVEVEVSWTVEAAGGEFVWTIEARNSWPQHTIDEIVFPMLKGLYLGDDYRDDWLAYPHHAGELTKNPIETYASPRYQEFNRAGSVRADGEWVREIPYCGLASMQWMDCFDDSGGIYFASHDHEFGLTGVIVYSGGNDHPWLGLGFRKYPLLAAGAAAASRPFILAVHDGDWRTGARRYRKWIEQYLEISRPPDELAAQAALYPHYDFKNHRGITYRFADIPRLYDAARAEGIKHFFIAAWNRGGFDTDYPEYQPDMDLGSNLDLEKGCRYIADQGGFVTFYVNARIFDTCSRFFPTLGRAWAIQDHRGVLTNEQYDGTSVFGVMCPGAPGWRKHLHDTAVWMVRAYHARGIYLDQLGSATPLPCYNQSHGHEAADGFNRGYLELLREISGSLRAERPDAFLMIENCGDIYSPHIFANLTWNGEHYDEFFDLYKYTFPEFLQINMVNPRRIEDRGERARWFYRDVRRAFLLGSIFWTEIGERFGPEDLDLLAYFRQALQMRIHLGPTLLGAEFAYHDELPGLGPGNGAGLRATNWRLSDGGRLLLAVNGTGQEGTLLLDLDRGLQERALAVSLLGPDGWTTPRRVRPSGASMEVPIGSLPFTAARIQPKDE